MPTDPTPKRVDAEALALEVVEIGGELNDSAGCLCEDCIQARRERHVACTACNREDRPDAEDVREEAARG